MKKLVIFGAGCAGKEALDFFGDEKVYCFIDNNSLKNEYCGKKVITFEKLKEIYPTVFIIVASFDYYNKMCEQLDEYQMIRYWVFSRGYQSQLKFSYMVNKELHHFLLKELLDFNNIKEYSRIAIYSHQSDLMLLLYELSDCGKDSCIKYIDADDKDHIIHNGYGIKSERIENIESEIDCLIIAVPRQDNKILQWTEGKKNYAIIDLFDYDRFVPEYHHKEMMEFKDKYKGKRCFLIGNGPSLNAEDLCMLADNKEITFASNKIFLIFNSIYWRPDFYCVSDPDVYDNYYEQIEALNVPYKVLNDYYASAGKYKVKDAYYFHMRAEEYLPNHPRFSEDVDIQTYVGYSVTYDIMLQLAFYMGFSKIYLLGMDHSFPNNNVLDNRGHFCENYFNERERKRYKKYDQILGFQKLNMSFEVAKKKALENKVHIYNATRGGMLEIFERVKFDDLF